MNICEAFPDIVHFRVNTGKALRDIVHSGILFTSGHSAPAALAAGRLRAFFAEIIPMGVYSSKNFYLQRGENHNR